MNRRRLKFILLVPIALMALFYLSGVVMVATADRSMEAMSSAPVQTDTIAIFGASGTAGDGILKAALADKGIQKIHVITRRSTPRIEQGVAAGRVQMSLHSDYEDYTAVREQIAEAEAVYWAIGISSLGMDEETYGRIHVDFPMQFVREWAAVSDQPDISFHYISSSDISEESTAMWAREKIRAEKSLFGFAADTPLRVIAYRPDYIGPTAEQAHLGQKMLYGFFRPVGAAVKATEIGQAMLEVTARGQDFPNESKVGTFGIIRLSDAYDNRTSDKK